jgi:urease accessory protein
MKRLDALTAEALPGPDHFPASVRQHWQARLTLGIEEAYGASRLLERTHSGPLRVQKPLYPEGNAVCHAIIVHPPGGVVGGDQLSIAARVGERASGLLTTPGAAKWYKANGYESRQQVTLEVGPHASLEWLPQETIFFDAANVRLDQTVNLAEDAAYIGAEILCFGRTASGESFRTGRIEQCTRIRRGGRLIWFEQGALDAGSHAMQSPLGLSGKTVCATMIAVGRQVPSAVIADLRGLCTDASGSPGSSGRFGVTQMKSLLVVRYLGDTSETARQLMMRAWQLLRPAIIGREAVVPRIWNT